MATVKSRMARGEIRDVLGGDPITHASNLKVGEPVEVGEATSPQGIGGQDQG